MKDPVIRQALMYYVKVTSWIAAPVVVIFLFRDLFGLDESKFKFIVAVVIAFGISIVGIMREIKEYKKTLKE